MPSVSSSNDQYQISITENDDIEQLKQDWQQLEPLSTAPFFLSWAWVSTWLTTYTPSTYTIRAIHQNKLVAIGLLTSSIERRRLVINAKQLRLNQTGHLTQDQIWVEYNDFLTDKNHTGAAVNACIKALTDSPLFNQHDEIIFSMMLEGRAKHLLASSPHSKILITRPCYGIDLSQLSEDRNYIQSLTSNTRYQIRRSIRQYEKTHGPLTLVHANSTEQALGFFNDVAPLHIQRWYDSGYKNPEFLQFHQNLIETYYSKGLIQLIKVMAGDTVIAILYYLIKGDNVSFYLHGLLYETDKKLKPGLVAHALATQFFFDNGMKTYDYMGGHSQYKTQLATRTEDLATIRIQKPIFKFILENTAQTIKNLAIRKHHDQS